MCVADLWQIVENVADCSRLWRFFLGEGTLSFQHHPTLHVKSGNFTRLNTPRSIGLHSTENRLTLHGESAYTPRSVNLPPKVYGANEAYEAYRANKAYGLMRPMGPIGPYSRNSYLASVCLLKNLKLQVPFRELFCYIEKKPYLYPADCEYK